MFDGRLQSSFNGQIYRLQSHQESPVSPDPQRTSGSETRQGTKSNSKYKDMETIQEKNKETMHKSDNESENEKKELLGKALQAHEQFLKALDALWEVDGKLCIITYKILDLALTAMMSSRAKVVSGELKKTQESEA